MELAVLNWIQPLRTGWLDGVMVSVSTLGDAGAVWIVLALVLLCFRKTRRAGVTVALALVLDLIVCNGILKPLFDRVRPCVVNPAAELLVRCPTDASFPSGHTAASFAAAARDSAVSPLPGVRMAST